MQFASTPVVPTRLRRLDDALGWLTEIPAAALVVAEIAILFAGVVSRYVFNKPLTWSDELASVLFLWLAMLGAVIALRRGERGEDQARQVVRQSVIGGEFGAALDGQRHAPDPCVSPAPGDFDQPLCGQRAQQAAQIAGIEPERGAQTAHFRAGEAGLEDQPRLAERPAAAEIAVVEGADAARDKPIEAADLLDRGVGHSLTLVREWVFASAARS